MTLPTDISSSPPNYTPGAHATHHNTAHGLLNGLNGTYVTPSDLSTALDALPSDEEVAAATYSPTRQACAIFNPAVTVATLSDSVAATNGLTWTANPSIAYYGTTFYAVFDGNKTATTEGQSGQKIYLKTSTDGVTWGAAVEVFSDTAYANNPITDSGVHFQPSLVVVGTELWCLWNGGPRGYLSKLTVSGAKWTNYRFEFSNTDVFLSSTVNGAATGSHSLTATFDGQSDWGPFFTSQPAVLADGTVACPLTFQSASIDATSPSDAPTFFRINKSNRIFYTSDQAATWTMSETISNGSTGGPSTQWEPTVWEAGNGDLWVYSRNNRTSLANANALVVARSPNRRSFEIAAVTQLEVPVTRPYVARLSASRWLMVDNDFPQNDTSDTTAMNTAGRQNGTLFMSRRGVDDFTPGYGWSGTTINQIYPQFVVSGGKIYVIFTEDRNGRRSLKLATIPSTPSSETTAYVYPRRWSEFQGSAPHLLGLSPDAWRFDNSQQATSAAALTTAADLAFSAWLALDVNSGVVIDSRQNNTSNYGLVLQTTGLSIGSLNFTHGQTISTTLPVFLAASVDNTLNKVSLYYAAAGATSLTQVDAFYKSLLFNSNPANNDTISVNGTTFTFKTSPTLGTHVQIGVDAATTAASLVTVLAANSMKATVTRLTTRVVCARTDQATFAASSATAAVTAETTTPLSGTTARVGFKRDATSTIPGLTGAVYDVRAFASTLSTNNVRFLYNNLAAGLGYATIAGTATDPGAPTVLFDPTATSVTFPDLGTVAASVGVSGTTLTLNGEASAAIELPYEATTVSLRFKLGAAPVSSEKYVLATFGTRSNNVELAISAAAPTAVTLGGSTVATLTDVTAWNMLDVTVTAGTVQVEGAGRKLNTGARMYLGAPFPSGLITADKTTQFDVSRMSAADGRTVITGRLYPNVVETVVSAWNFTGNPQFSGNPGFSGTPAFTGTPTFANVPAALAAAVHTHAEADITSLVADLLAKERLDPDLLTTGEGCFPRDKVVANTVPTGNQSLRLSYFTARKSETITQVRILSGGTAAGATPTLVRVGLYTVAANGDITLVASTANDTTLLASGSTSYTKALQASYAKVAGQRYAVGILVVTGATAPTVCGGPNFINATESGLAPKLGGLVGSQADLPSSVVAASVSDGAQRPYVVMLP